MTTAATEEHSAVRSEDRDRLLARLARVEGQLRGVQRMIREGSPCESVAQQLAAARGGLHGAFCDLVACAFEARIDTMEMEADPGALRGRVGDLTELLKKYA